LLNRPEKTVTIFQEQTSDTLQCAAMQQPHTVEAAAEESRKNGLIMICHYGKKKVATTAFRM
jgi:hypothetical protein